VGHPKLWKKTRSIWPKGKTTRTIPERCWPMRIRIPKKRYSKDPPVVVVFVVVVDVDVVAGTWNGIRSDERPQPTKVGHRRRKRAMMSPTEA
jgi:hypothetical protein